MPVFSERLQIRFDFCHRQLNTLRFCGVFFWLSGAGRLREGLGEGTARPKKRSVIASESSRGLSRSESI